MKKKLLLNFLTWLFVFAGAINLATTNAQTVDDTGLFDSIKAGSTDTIVHASMVFYDANTNGNFDASFVLSAGPITTWGDYSTALAFYEEGFQVRDGGGFTKSKTIIPEAGEVLEVWIDVDIVTQTANTWVQTSIMDYPALIHPDAGFRRTPVDSLVRWSALHNPAGEPDTVDVTMVEMAASIPGLDVSTLSALTIDYGMLDPAFDPGVTSYDVLLPYGTTGEINVSATASALDATVSGAGAIDVTSGSAKDTITVISFDLSDTTHYYIDFTVDDGSTDAYLDTIIVDTSALDPVFDMMTFEYTVYVPVGTDSVDVSASPNYPGASVVGDSTIAITDGTGTTSIVVTATDDVTTRTYTVNFIEADGENYGMYLPGVDGNNSNVDISGLPVTSWPLTVEFWIKPDGTQNAYSGLFYHRGTGNAGVQYSAGWQSGGTLLRLNTNTGGNGLLSAAISPDIWHHVAMVITDTSRTLYLDGTSYYEKVDIPAYDFSADKLYLGWDAAVNDRAFKGIIDEVRVWSEYKDSATLADNKFDILTGNEAGLVAYYNFNLTSPTVAVDLTDNELHGAITGGSYVIAFDPADATLSALDLDIAALDPVFHPDSTSYTVIFPVGTTSINVTATPMNLSATIAGDGAVDVSSGSGTANIVVTAQNGVDEQTYTIDFVEADGKNYAIYLPGGDGNNSNIDITGLGITTLPYTFEMWIKPEGNQINNAGLIYHRGTGNAGIQYSSSWQGSGKLRFMTNIGGDYGTVTDVVSTDTWHHVAAVLTNTTRTIYLDGVKYTQDIGNSDYNYSDGKLYLGWDAAASDRAFKGIIDEVRVWNVARDSATIADNKLETFVGDETGLVGYWNFDLTNSSQAVDLSINLLHGLIAGGTYVPSFDTTDASLADITTSVGGIDPVFNADTLEYTVIVPMGTDSAVVTAATNHPFATLTGDGTVYITSGTGTANIVVTAVDGVTTRTYVLNFVEHDGSLTLTHSYTFEDGTAADVVGGADGIINGGAISGGIFTSSAEGDYIVLPGEEIAFYRYPAITLEAMITAGDGTNTGYTMLAYFGDMTGSNSYWIQLTRADDLSRTETMTGSAPAANAKGPEIDDGALHHIVSVLTYDTIYWYIDGSLEEKTATGSNAINGISTANSWLNASGWPDPTWLGSIHEFNIYSGAMGADVVMANAIAFLPANEAALSGIALDVGTLNPAFSQFVTEYSVIVPEGTTTVNVTATPVDTEATVSGDGAIDVSSGTGTASIVVTAADGVTTTTYTVNIDVVRPPDAPTLTHSYLFEDGTADDNVGDVDGVLVGGATVAGGSLVLADGQSVSLSGKEIDIPSYNQVTVEAWYTPEGGTNTGFHTLFAFGRTVGTLGVDYFQFQPARADAENTAMTHISCRNETEPWTAETSVSTGEKDDAVMHHVVSIADAEGISMYLDSVFIEFAEYTGDNALDSVSNDTAFFGKSVYINDPTWKGTIQEINIYDTVLSAGQVAYQYAHGPAHEAGTDATLSALTVDAGTLKPAFNPDSLNYTVDDVPQGTTSVTVSATANDPMANVAGAGAVDVTSGSGTATIVVTAEDGTTTETYTVEITVLVGIQDLHASFATVYPTVSSEWFNIRFAGTPGTITVYDLTGKVVLKRMAVSSIESISIPEAGIYLMKIESESNSKLVKVVKLK